MERTANASLGPGTALRSLPRAGGALQCGCAQALYLARCVHLPRGAEVPQDLPTPSQNRVLSVHTSTPRLGDAKQSAKLRQNGQGFSREAAGLEGTRGLLAQPHSPPRDGGRVLPFWSPMSSPGNGGRTGTNLTGLPED